MNVFWELNGVNCFVVNGSNGLNLTIGFLLNRQIASMSGSPSQNSACTKGVIFVLPLYSMLFLTCKYSIGNPLCHKSLWLVGEMGSKYGQPVFSYKSN